MEPIVIASNQADARAAEAVEQHHAQLAGALALKVESLAAVARAGRGLNPTVHSDLVDWCRNELIPHALAEERTLYRAAADQPEARLLVEAMLVEHRLIVDLADDLEEAKDATTAAVVAGALRAVFEAHLAKENTQILPLLVGAPDVSVAELLGGMHELLGGERDHDPHQHEEVGGRADHTCGCHDGDDGQFPTLDARSIPHSTRHATIFGALDGVLPGAGMVLLAPHDPLPLLAQIDQRAPGDFTVDYLERGPETWRLSIVRTPTGARNA